MVVELPPQSQTSFQRLLAAKIAKQPISKVTQTKAVPHHIEFGPLVILAGKSETQTIVPVPSLFRGERFINIAESDDLYITGVFVGHTKQLPASATLAVMPFCSPLNSGIKLDTYQSPSFGISITVENRGSVNRRFHIQLHGKAVF